MVLGPEIGRGNRAIVFGWLGDGADADTGDATELIATELIAKVPLDATPDKWILMESRYADSAGHSVAARQGTGVRVPATAGTRSVHGRTVSLNERIDGPSMWERLGRGSDSGVECGRSLAAIELALFSATPSAALPQQHDRLATKIRLAAKRLDRPGLNIAVELLEQCREEDGGRWGLCHGDLHLRNVLLSDGEAVVIDWFDASRGTLGLEVARTLLLLDRSVGHTGPDAVSPDALADVRSSYLEAIAASGALAGDRIDEWLLVQAVARLSERVAAEPVPDLDALESRLGEWASLRRR